MQKREHNLIAEDTPWKKKIFRIIYFSDTPSGKIFDLLLLLMIILSTFIVMMESVQKVDEHYHSLLVSFRMAHYHCFYDRITV